MIGVAKLRKLALSVTVSELQGSIQELRKRADDPLFRTYRQLANILRQQSREAKEREEERARQDRERENERKMKEASVLQKNAPGPRMPSTVTVTPQKRNISETSFGTASTETTPTKLTKPEQHIQLLQDTLVSDILLHVYRCDVPVPWAEGRELYLSYGP